MEEDDKGCPMIRMGVSGWVFLLVPAYPGCPGPKAVKRLCACVLHRNDSIRCGLLLHIQHGLSACLLVTAKPIEMLFGCRLVRPKEPSPYLFCVWLWQWMQIHENKTLLWLKISIKPSNKGKNFDSVLVKIIHNDSINGIRLDHYSIKISQTLYILNHTLVITTIARHVNVQ